MDENIEKVKKVVAKGNAVAIDNGRNVFHIVRNTLVENWKSGIAGKIFLVATGFIFLWLIAPLFVGHEVVSSTEGGSMAGGTPTEVLKRYYQAYFNGDFNGYMACLDNPQEQDNDSASEIAKDFQRDDWRERISSLYGIVSYGVPSWSDDGKMNIKVDIENRKDGGSSTKNWSLINKNGNWFIDTDLTTNPFEMGL